LSEVETYPGAGHAFDNPLPMFHHAGASALAWRRTTEFLASRLPTS
jgi:carboxymethylenebutenolidase